MHSTLQILKNWLFHFGDDILFLPYHDYPAKHSIVQQWVKRHCHVRNHNKPIIITEMQLNLQKQIKSAVVILLKYW